MFYDYIRPMSIFHQRVIFTASSKYICVKGGCVPVFEDGADFCYMHHYLYEVSCIYIYITLYWSQPGASIDERAVVDFLGFNLNHSYFEVNKHLL